MLQNITELYGNKLAASDGEIGLVQDFYFDDETWALRYLLADTGSWLSGRQVLLSPHAFGRWDRDGKFLTVHLTRKQIENSPSIESHQPVSRQYEIEYYQYYGWPSYWYGGALWGFGGYPAVLPPSQERMAAHLHQHRADVHLRSAKAVTGYAVHALDGEIGSVRSFMVDDKSWAVGELVVETGHWYSGKEILIPTSRINRISYEESKVGVNLTRADLRTSGRTDKTKSRKSGAEIRGQRIICAKAGPALTGIGPVRRMGE